MINHLLDFMLQWHINSTTRQVGDALTKAKLRQVRKDKREKRKKREGKSLEVLEASVTITSTGTLEWVALYKCISVKFGAKFMLGNEVRWIRISLHEQIHLYCSRNGSSANSSSNSSSSSTLSASNKFWTPSLSAFGSKGLFGCKKRIFFLFQASETWLYWLPFMREFSSKKYKAWQKRKIHLEMW